MKRYRISPSLMNKFSDWLNYEELYEQFWGRSEQPPMTMDEFGAKQLAELLAYINGDPIPTTEAAERGTALNDLIDALQHGRSVDTSYIEQNGCYVASRRGYTFVFGKDFVDSLCLLFSTAVPQVHVEYETSLEDPIGGNVDIVLHGYPDYIFPTMIWDLKTTTKYDFGKYENNWQRFVYPYIAVKTGIMTECERFTFYALTMTSDNGVLTGKPNAETYDCNYYHDGYIIDDMLATMVGRLIEWERDGLVREGHVIQHI